MNAKKMMIYRKRRERDLSKLVSSGYKIERSKSNQNEVTVEFKGPSDSFYENGFWKILILFPDMYPYKSPSIGFLNKIFHPNIDFNSGSICLDVINQTWSPMFELVNIFD